MNKFKPITYKPKEAKEEKIRESECMIEERKEKPDWNEVIRMLPNIQSVKFTGFKIIS